MKMENIIGNLISSLGKYLLVFSFFLRKNAFRYNLLFRERYGKVLGLDSYKYTFFSLTVIAIYFLIKALFDFSDQLILSRHFIDYSFEFNLDKSFILICLITLVLINILTYSWRRNTKNLRIMRRFTVYTFSSQIIYIFLFLSITLGILVCNKNTDFLNEFTLYFIFAPLVWGILVLTFLDPYQNINTALRLESIDVPTARKLKALVFLPLIFATMVAIFIATLPSDKPFTLKFPPIGDHRDIDVPKISIRSVGRDSLMLTCKFVIRTNIEAPMMISCQKTTFFTNFGYYRLAWMITNQVSPYVILRKNEPLYLELQTNDTQRNIKEFLSNGIKHYRLHFRTIDEETFYLY